MSAARLATHIEASALIRRVEHLGGCGYVLARRHHEAGTILVVLMQRGDFRAVFDRALALDGGYRWQERLAKEIEEKQSLNDFISAQRRIDPDIWVLELDVPQAERFAAQLVDEG